MTFILTVTHICTFSYQNVYIKYMERKKHNSLQHKLKFYKHKNQIGE